jgi:rhodanese-related sulfurtransferase
MQHSEGFLKLTEDALQRIKEITIDETVARLRKGGAHLIDVREESEWNKDHIDGAIHLSKGIIERDIETRIPDKEAPILCYCGGGYRSALVVDNLQKMGYTNVLSVKGGYRGWVDAGHPLTSRPEIVPRSPYLKLAGLVHLPRFIDKARLYPAGKLPGYNYLTYGFDKTLLDFLCIEPSFFEEAVANSKDDESVVAALRQKLGPAWPSDHAINDFNEKLIRRKPETAEKQAKFDHDRSKLPPTKKKVETSFDLIELYEGRMETSS